MSSCICNHILCTAIDKTMPSQDLANWLPQNTADSWNFETLSYFRFTSPCGLIIAWSLAPRTDPS